MRFDGRVVLAAAWAITCITAAGVAAEESPWDKFDLATTEVGGITLHYDKAFEPRIGDVKDTITKYLDGAKTVRARVATLTEGDAVFNDVDALVGLTPPDDFKAMRRSVFARFAGQGAAVLEGIKDVCLVQQDAVKERLRAGETFPGFTYDKATDTATYNFGVHYSSSGAGEGAKGASGSIALPVKDADDAAKMVDSFFKMLEGGGRLGTAIREIAEMSIRARLNESDPHLRWFVEGFSSAAARQLLEKYVGEAAAKDYAADSGTEAFADIQKGVNLAYWMDTDFEVKTPLKSEGRLGSARYAFATLEARRLVDAHGSACLKAILDKTSTAAGTTPGGLVAIIKEATGEDVAPRLAEYQSFETRQKGLELYTAQIKPAVDRKDYAAALPPILRVIELEDGYNPAQYAAAAICLARMGREDLGDLVFQTQQRNLERTKQPKVLAMLKARLVDYAFQVGKPGKAFQAAEDILSARPDYVPALAVRMYKFAASGQKDEAVKTAQRILELDKNTGSFFNRGAQEIVSGPAKEPGTSTSSEMQAAPAP